MSSRIIHIVLFEFEPTLKLEEIKRICTHMLSLSSKCVHPTSQKPYIVSCTGGRDNSPEGLSGAFTHAFIVEFQSEEDRNYYVKEDPAHQEFVKGLAGKVVHARVLDFTPGII